MSIGATLLLNSVPQLGVATYWKLLDAFGSAEAVLAANREQLSQGLKPALVDEVIALQNAKHPTHAWVDAILAWVEASDVSLIHHADRRYPSQLSEISTAPPLLYAKGNLALLKAPQVAIVGSRSATQNGLHGAKLLAQQLSAVGVTVTSGLALGIDSAAHAGAIEAQASTIAVVGTGIDIVYPSRNRSLAEKILAKDGLIISEFPPGTKATPQNFPRRNRIISGLSMGTVVVEAAVKSGSLITARYALEQNREVFALPGSIHNPLSRGCHSLIKQGAILIEGIEDILQILELQVAPHKTNESSENLTLQGDTAQLYDMIQFDPVKLDSLMELGILPIDKLLAELTQLEIMGLIVNEANGYVRAAASV